MSYRIINGIYKVWDDEEKTFTLPDEAVVPAIIRESGTWISSNGIDFDCLVIPSEKYEAERAAEEATRLEAEANRPPTEIEKLKEELAAAQSAIDFVLMNY